MKAAPLGSRCVRVCICISLSVSLAHTRTHTCDNGSEEGVGVASALSLLALSVAYFGACERGSEWRVESGERNRNRKSGNL